MDKPHTQRGDRSSHPFAKDQEIQTHAVIASEETTKTPKAPWTTSEEEEASVANAPASSTMAFNSAGAPEQQKKQRTSPRRHSTLTLTLAANYAKTGKLNKPTGRLSFPSLSDTDEGAGEEGEAANRDRGHRNRPSPEFLTVTRGKERERTTMS